MYNAKKIQETPPPLALTALDSPRFLDPLLVSIGVLLFAGLVVMLTLFVRAKIAKHADEQALAKNTEFKKYELTEKPFTGRLYKSDQLIMGSDAGNIFLTVAETEGIFETALTR